MNRKPINIFNGLKIEIQNNNINQIDKKTVSNLVAIKAFQNSKNITKPFVKPISKII